MGKIPREDVDNDEDKNENGDDWTNPLRRQYAGEAAVRAGERQGGTG